MVARSLIRKGLSNLKNMYKAVSRKGKDKNKKFFGKEGIGDEMILVATYRTGLFHSRESYSY
jgi:glutamine synthetase type III